LKLRRKNSMVSTLQKPALVAAEASGKANTIV
jgi:hypothetical protein